MFPDADADEQYAACVHCSDLTDLSESHPTYETHEEVEATNERVLRRYHFCSDDCLDAWKAENMDFD